jgi:hypothetical protein
MEETKTSPVPFMAGKAIMLDFFDALKQLAAGKRITRLEWDNKMIYGVLKDGMVLMHKENEWHTWVINDGDLMGKDWIVLEEQVVNNLASD